MEKWYIVKGLGSSFDGLTVVGNEKPIYKTSLVEILKIVNTNVVFGDRNLTIQLPNNSMFIESKYLQLIENPETREYDSKNPWGKFIYESQAITNSFKVVWAKFADCITVTVLEKQNNKTKYYYNFTNKNKFQDLEKELVKSDDDIIFMLTSLEEEKK